MTRAAERAQAEQGYLAGQLLALARAARRAERAERRIHQGAARPSRLGRIRVMTFRPQNALSISIGPVSILWNGVAGHNGDSDDNDMTLLPERLS